MNKTLNTILSVVLYSLACTILANAGVTTSNWQFWTLIVAILAIDLLSFARGVGQGIEIKSRTE